MLVKMIITNIIVVSVTSAADVTLVQETVAVEDDVHASDDLWEDLMHRAALSFSHAPARGLG